jgi:hypothetical protein
VLRRELHGDLDRGLYPSREVAGEGVSVNRESAATPSGQAATLSGGTDTAALSADERLEIAIEATRQALLGAKTPAVQRELAEQMKRMIGQRSPWQIAKLEKERGLTR